MTPALPVLLLLAVRLAAAEPPPPPAPPADPAASATEKAPVSDAAPAKAGAAATDSRRVGEWPAKPSGRKVTLEGTMTVDQALGKISDAAGWSLIASSGPDGAKSLTLRLRRIPVEDALDAILQGTSLVASRRGTMVTVTPARPGAGGATVVAAPSEDGSGAEPAKSPKEIRRELRQKLREQKRELRAARGDKADRVGQGDQVVATGTTTDNVVAILGNVRIEPGATTQDVVAVLGAVEIGPGATVDGDVVAVGGDVHLLVGAHVTGDAVAVGGKVITDMGATIDGQQSSVAVPGLAGALGLIGGRSWSPHASRALSVAGLIARFAVFFAFALLIMAIAPRRLENLAAGLTNAPVKTAVTGVLGTIALPLAALLLAVTVIGIPLIAVLVLGVLVAAVMGYSALALFIGRAIPLRVERARTALQLAIGTAIILVLGEIPVLGWMVWITGWLFVVGVVWRTRLGRPVAAPVVPPPIYGTTPPPAPPIEPPPTSGPPAPPMPPVPPSAGGTTP